MFKRDRACVILLCHALPLRQIDVVRAHHPVFSYGKHGDQPEMVERIKPLLEVVGAHHPVFSYGKHGDQPEMVERIKPLLEVVGAHHPVFSYGKHGDQPEMVERIKPLLEYGVDVYINGHDHNMQHIKKDESPVHYFTVGGGSKAWRGDAPPVAPGLRFFFPGQGFSSLEVSRNSLTVKFYGELRDLQPTLLDAATYAEEAYLVTDQKDIEIHNVRDYAVSMLVSVVDRIGAAADRFTDAVSLQAKEMAAADVRVASAAERVRACWEYSGRNALNRQQQPRPTSRMPKSYQLPGVPSVRATLDFLAGPPPSSSSQSTHFLTGSCTHFPTRSRNTWAIEARTLDKARNPPLPKGTSPSLPPPCNPWVLQALMTWRAVIGGPQRHIGAADNC
ncbi:unnamed protein product [Closterium sp. Yama58-4]|nr:unnamed protein product [Closterium sp. Yama58-4]